MHILKQSTAATDTVGPILDSTGAEYTGAVIGDLSISKNGTEAAMAAAATLTHISNGMYTLVYTTGNTDTLGRIVVRCNKSTYQMPPVRYEVVASAVFDTLITNGTLASTTSGRTIVVDAAGLADANVVKLGPTGSGTAQTARDIGASVLLAGGRVLPAAEIGDITEDATIVLRFNTMSSAQAPITLAGSPVLSVYKDSITQRAGAEITLTVDYDGVTGLHHVSIDTSGDAFYEIGKNYTVVITTGTVGGVSVVGSVVGSFSIENRFAEVDVVKLNGGAQSLLDLKDFADDGYDPSTNKVQGVVLTDTVTTLTGHTAQTGDAYAIVNSGTFGNSALKTLIDTVDTVVDAIKAKTDNLPSDPADASVVAGLIAAVQAVVDAVLVDTNELQTDWVNGGRLDLLIDAIKTATDKIDSAHAEPTGAPAANATPLAKLGYVFAALRNKLEVTASAKTFYDDAGAALWSKTLADDGTTYSETEGV